MRINKKSQYALSFCIYLRRVGHTNTKSAAQALGLSHAFLEQVVRMLRVSGVVSVRKGPGGGYWLPQGLSPTIGEILSAVGSNWIVDEQVNNNVSGVISALDKALMEVYGKSIEEFTEASAPVAEAVRIST